jgi:cell division septation protein DedD
MTKRRHLATALAAFALLGAVRSMAQPAPVACPPPKPGVTIAGKMCVLLSVQNGLIVAPDANISFWFAPDFAHKLSPRVSIDSVQAALKHDLQQKLAQMRMPYLSALASGEADSSLTDPLTEALRHFNGSFSDYVNAMQRWHDANPSRKSPEDILVASPEGDPKKSFFAPITLPNVDTPLNFDESIPGFERGRATFAIFAPFQADAVQFSIPASTAAQQARVRDLRRVLAPLNGTLWDGVAVKKRLQDYYSRLGLPTEIVVLPSHQIAVKETARIAHVILMNPDVAEHDVDKVLWTVLTQHDFNVAMKHRPVVKGGERTLDYTADLGYAAGDEPYALASRLQTQQLTLSQFGLSALLIPSTRSTAQQTYQDLRIQKTAANPPADSTKPKPGAPTVDAHGQVAVNPAPTPTPVANPAATPTPSPAPAKAEKEKLWYVGGGGTYRPGQAFSVFGLVQRSRLSVPFANSTISGQLGYPYGSVASLNYSADYIGFNQLHQRLSLRLNGSQDVQIHRFLLGQQLDEHRTGGFGQVMLEPFHDLDNSLLQVTAEVRRATVSEQNNVATQLKLNLSTVRVSGLYLFQTELSEHPHSFKLEPFVEVGLGLSATEPTFTLGGISANYHQALGSIAADFTGHFENSTAGTPVVEQPSFGGADVMRGFRADDAIGLRYWSLQNELWFPLPRLAAAVSNTQLKTLLSQLRLAPFLDVGGAYQTVSSAPGVRLGPGMGLRFAMDRVVLKLDWAYGIGDAATGGSRGKFYFTLVSNLPL